MGSQRKVQSEHHASDPPSLSLALLYAVGMVTKLTLRMSDRTTILSPSVSNIGWTVVADVMCRPSWDKPLEVSASATEELLCDTRPFLLPLLCCAILSAAIQRLLDLSFLFVLISIDSNAGVVMLYHIYLSLPLSYPD